MMEIITNFTWWSAKLFHKNREINFTSYKLKEFNYTIETIFSPSHLPTGGQARPLLIRGGDLGVVLNTKGRLQFF